MSSTYTRNVHIICLMKTCARCEQEKRLSEFYREPRNTDGHMGTCKPCVLARTKQWQQMNPVKRLMNERRWKTENPDRHRALTRAYQQRNKARLRTRLQDHRLKYPQKYHAHKIVQYAIKTGQLERPLTCSQCHRTAKIQAHHQDYSKPLEVIWLCRRCHYYADVTLGLTSPPVLPAYSK